MESHYCVYQPLSFSLFGEEGLTMAECGLRRHTSKQIERNENEESSEEYSNEQNEESS
jgi:hypothetical protein